MLDQCLGGEINGLVVLNCLHQQAFSDELFSGCCHILHVRPNHDSTQEKIPERTHLSLFCLDVFLPYLALETIEGYTYPLALLLTTGENFFDHLNFCLRLYRCGHSISRKCWGLRHHSNYNDQFCQCLKNKKDP